jgi:TRAP-type transport system periplasmic protein
LTIVKVGTPIVAEDGRAVATIFGSGEAMRSTVRMGRRAAGTGLAAAVLAPGAVAARAGRLQAQQPAPGDAVTFRAVSTPDLHGAIAPAVERLAGALEQMSQGRVRVAVEPDAADTGAVLDAVRGGEAMLGWVRLAEIAGLVPEVAALSTPFLFRDPQKALAILDAASLGPLLDDQLRKRGLEPLGYLNVGALRLAGSAPPALEDLAGQRIAARPGALREVAFRALGLELAPGAFEAGVIKGAVPMAELRTDDLAAAGGGQGERRAVTQAPHAHDLVLLCANHRHFESLLFAPDVMEMLRTQAQETAVWQRGGTTQVDAAAMQALRQRDIEVVVLPEEELRRAHERVKAAVAEALSGAEPSIVRTVLAYAD